MYQTRVVKVCTTLFSLFYRQQSLHCEKGLALSYFGRKRLWFVTKMASHNNLEYPRGPCENPSPLHVLCTLTTHTMQMITNFEGCHSIVVVICLSFHPADRPAINQFLNFVQAPLRLHFQSLMPFRELLIKILLFQILYDFCGSLFEKQLGLSAKTTTKEEGYFFSKLSRCEIERTTCFATLASSCEFVTNIFAYKSTLKRVIYQPLYMLNCCFKTVCALLKDHQKTLLGPSN